MELHTITCNNLPLDFIVARSKKRRRTISIQVSKVKGVEIKVPHKTSSQQIIEIIQQRFAWIQQQLATLPDKESVQPWHEQSTLFYLGEPYAVQCDTFPFIKKRGECVLEAGQLKVTLAQNLEGPERKKLMLKTVEYWYRQRAAEILRERTDYFAALLNVKPNKIIIKAQKSRWGSCDRDNNIRYNWKVIMTAMPLIDYLVVHELAHIRVKNHSKKFWDLVASILPDHQARRKNLHEFGKEFLCD